MLEEYQPVDPPEIREPTERYRIVEFYVHLGDPRPDMLLVQMIHEWLANNAPCPLYNINVSYQRATGDEPDRLVGLMMIGEPIDIG